MLSPDRDDDALMAEQIAYYRANAPQYDRPYAEVAHLKRLLTKLDDLPITGDVLELACGTGQWTSLLAPRARTVTALDTSAEVLSIARTRAPHPNVEFIQTDLFEWHPPRRYDTVFFAFWLSHVPPRRLPAFWTKVATMLTPQGAAVFIDDGPTAATTEEGLEPGPIPTVQRRVDNGTTYRIVKVFHDPRTLTADLTALGWTPRIHQTRTNIIGTAQKQRGRHPR